ncbi:MAG: hypothetical protein WBH44_10455 [Proteocatella sp.]
MKSGIDSQGKKVYYNDAIVEKRYFCPYCTERLVLKRGEKACFAHNPKKERTPLERTCPEYHENTSYKKIDNAADVVYINNGGIPLYLCDDGNKFELRAYFPSVSEICTKSLIESKTEVIVNNKKWCYVETLNYYPVSIIEKWIDIKVKPDTKLQEVKRKWLWGIRGINIEKDMYHANNEGGYRVAINANIYVGKKYRMIFSKDIPTVLGIEFKRLGVIRLKEYGEQKQFFIYEISIKQFTEESRQFIEGKGYCFVEKPSKLIPVWPPAISRGNELIFDKETAWFYNASSVNKEYVNEMQGRTISNTLSRNKIFKISGISIYSEKAIVATNKLVQGQKIAGVGAEIKYILKYKKIFNNKNILEPQIIISDIEGRFIDYTQSNNPIPKAGYLSINSNIPIMAKVTKGSYCLYSNKYSLEGISYGSTININCKGFGNIFYQYNKVYTDGKKTNQVDWKLLYNKLYKCRGAKVAPNYMNKLLLYKFKDKLNKENKLVYKILYGWIQKGEIPIGSQRLLDEIKKGIYND